MAERTYTLTRERREGLICGEVRAALPAARARTKAQAFVNLGAVQFERDGFRVRLLAAPEVRRGLLVVRVAATHNGARVPGDGVLVFSNPPIMVPDGTWHKTTNQFGDAVEVQNFREDVGQALEIIICDALRTLI